MKNIYTKLLILVTVLGIIFTLNALSNEVEAEAKNTDTLFYIGENTNGPGHLFLQPSSEYENVILVSLSDLNDWDISVSNVSIGHKYTATFTDDTLWTIKSIKRN